MQCSNALRVVGYRRRARGRRSKRHYLCVTSFFLVLVADCSVGTRVMVVLVLEDMAVVIDVIHCSHGQATIIGSECNVLCRCAKDDETAGSIASHSKNRLAAASQR
jgi:hypothetical protein